MFTAKHEVISRLTQHMRSRACISNLYRRVSSYSHQSTACFRPQHVSRATSGYVGPCGYSQLALRNSALTCTGKRVRKYCSATSDAPAREKFEMTPTHRTILQKVPGLEEKAEELLEILPYRNPLPMLKESPALILQPKEVLQARYDKIAEVLGAYDYEAIVCNRPALLCQDHEVTNMIERLENIEARLKNVDLKKALENAANKRVGSVTPLQMHKLLAMLSHRYPDVEDVSTIVNGVAQILTFNLPILGKRFKELDRQQLAYPSTDIKKDVVRFPELLLFPTRLDRLAYFYTLDPTTWTDEKIRTGLKQGKTAFERLHGDWKTRLLIASKNSG